MDERTEIPGSTPDGTPDEAYARLRAADPAAGADRPAQDDLAGLRARVDARTGPRGASAADDGPAGPGQDVTGADEGVAVVVPLERARRRRAPWLVAAAVAGVVAVGGGGYAVGAATGPGGPSTGVALAPISLEGAAGGGAESLAGSPEPGVGRSLAAGAADASSLAYPGSWGRTVFTASGLGTDGTTAPAWALDAAAVFSAETARRVADALGATGEPRQEHGSWAVGPVDGSGPTVQLVPDGTASFQAWDPTRDPWRCTDGAATVEPAPADDGADGDGSAASTLACATPDPGPAPDDATAAAALRDVMTRLEVDPAGFEVVVDPGGQGDPARWVTAYQVVDGQRTGLAWSASVVADGLQSVSGFLAGTTSLGDYPVVSPAAAVERLGDPRFGGSASPVLLARDAVTLPGVPSPEGTAPTVPATPEAGSAVPWPVSRVTIVEARLGLAVQHTPDGAALLLPAYELRDADGNAWSVVAVAEERLDLDG